MLGSMVRRILEGGDSRATCPLLELPHLQQDDAPIGLITVKMEVCRLSQTAVTKAMARPTDTVDRNCELPNMESETTTSQGDSTIDPRRAKVGEQLSVTVHGWATDVFSVVSDLHGHI